MTPLYFTPRYRYVPLSLTGSWCALGCKFCKGRYLVNMLHVTPSSFVDAMRELYASGVRGVLLSGGFRRDAMLPIEPYVDKLGLVRSECGIFISAHLGLVTDRDLLLSLRELIDVVDYEFTLSQFIINYVRGLAFGAGRYVEALTRIIECGLRVVPHIYVWHPEISVDALREELKTVGELGINEVTLLVYMDPSTVYEPTKLARTVESYVELAANVFPGKLYMGCMRPSYIKPLLDPLLVERELVERIANPHYSVLREHPGEVYDACCSIPINQATRSLFLTKDTVKGLQQTSRDAC